MKIKLAITGAVFFFLIIAGTCLYWATTTTRTNFIPIAINVNSSNIKEPNIINTVIETSSSQTSDETWRGDNFWIGSNIVITDAHSGMVVDTWTSDVTLQNGYQYHIGQPLCISIYNNTDEPKQYEIGLDNIPLDQPEGYSDWIKLADLNPIVQPKTVSDIPLSIIFPDKLSKDISPKWEIRIYVVSIKGSGFQVAGELRILVNMR